jgi:hypothetical protein
MKCHKTRTTQLEMCANSRLKGYSAECNVQKNEEGRL